MVKKETTEQLLAQIRDLLLEQKPQTDSVSIDVDDALTQLGTGKLNLSLRHYYQWNDRWVKLLEERNRRAAKSTYDFIEREMPYATFLSNQFDMLTNLAPEIAEHGGDLLDLGVYKGASTRALAKIFPDKTIHGFDSFEGLPGDWAHVLEGAFGDISGKLPEMPGNVKLYKGWFSDTLPPWKGSEATDHISLLRVDCDIYSSTKDIFDAVGDLLRDKTIICFDELFGYWGWEAHEYKAFMEYIDATGFNYEYVSYGLTYCIVRLRTPVRDQIVNEFFP